MTEPGGLAAQAIHQYGYLGLGFTLAINCMGVPIASEITLPLAGVLARTGTFDLIAVFSVAFVAQMVGLSLSYVLARHGGVELVERYGRYFFMNRKHLAKLQKHFERHGARLILIGASLPGLHGYVGYPAGLAKMNFGLFVSVAGLGVAVWTAGLMGLGWLLADHMDWILAAANGVGLVGGAIVLLVVGFIWYSRHHGRK